MPNRLIDGANPTFQVVTEQPNILFTSRSAKEFTLALFKIIVPATWVIVSIAVFVQSLALFDTIKDIAFVGLSVNECVETFACHLVVAPLSTIDLTLYKIMYTIAWPNSIFYTSPVNTSVWVF
jgi:hypothetical protein